MSKQLDKYTKAVEALKAHGANNKKVFAEHIELVGQMSDAQEELMAYIKTKKETESNGIFTAQFIQPYKKGYNYEMVMSLLNPKQQKIVTDRAVQHKILVDEFNQLVDEKIVPKEVKVKAFVEEAQTPRVSIKEVNPEE